MKRPNLILLAVVAGVSGLVGSQLFRSTQGTLFGSGVMLACGLVALGFVGYVAWLLIFKNQKIVKASAADKASALLFNAEADRGVIYVYRSQYAGFLVGMDVMLDATLIGQTRGYCFYRLVVMPGTHIIGGDKRCIASAKIELGAGDIAYVEQEIVMSATQGGHQFKIAADIAKAQTAMRKCKLLSSLPFEQKMP